MTTSVIEASALCRVFASEDGREPVRAVDGVTFAVPPEARLVALIGPDGAGKSTLMQMICGLVGQDSGSLSVLGRTPDPDDEDFVNAVGYMPQTLGLYKDLSVMENMKLFGALRGTKPPEGMTIEAYYASLIALTGLEGFEGRPAGKLSGGMKQKLALAVALVRAPALLLLDEPTVGVDPLSRRELWAVIRRMVGQGGTTCFFSTAYLEEAESADWVLCMSEGRIIGSGTPAELLGRTKGRTYALDLSGFSDAERKSLSRRMMLKVSPAPEKSVFLDAVPRDGGIDLLLNAPNTREFAEREVELALRRDETGTVPDFDVLERAPRMEDAYRSTLDGEVREMEDQFADQVAAAGGSYVLVTLESGQTLTGRAGTELLMRTGTAAVTQSAAIDLTTGETAAVGAKLTENHLYLVQADGAGIQATANTTVMVRGGYSVG